MTEHRPHCIHSNGVSNGYESNGIVNGSDEDTPPALKGSAHKWCHKKVTRMESDVINLIGQHLRENGFNKTLDCLIEESGCELEHPLAGTFRKNVLNGEWPQAMSTLDQLAPLLNNDRNIQKMKLLIKEEEYLELLESGERLLALQCLRHDLTNLPLYHPEKKIQNLSQYVMCHSKEELLRVANWPGVKGGARERLMDQLQDFLPAAVMLPSRRLSYLLRQSLQLQVQQCPFHYEDNDLSTYSLLTDHICSRTHFPSEAVHTLKEHSDEIWFLQFSHDGTRLASGCKDGQIFIWAIEPSERPKKSHSIKAQPSGVTVLQWSPDDSLLLCCGAEDCTEVIVYDTSNWTEKCRVSNSTEDSLTCCAWHHSGRKFYVGGLRGQFYECSAEDGSITSSWEGVRLHAIATHPYNETVYGADSHMRVRQYNFEDKTHSTLIKEDHPIMSLSLSKDARYALLNVASQGVHLWDLNDQCLVRRYQGVTQGFYTIHSCFGINDSFVASGSEDHHVYIWNQRKEAPVIVLKTHSKTVNCISWNPVHPFMIASASDDCSIILWGTEDEMKKQREVQNILHQESNASSVHVNGVSSIERDEESYEEEEEEEEEEEDEDEDEEGMDMRGSSRPLSESDLHALEMLEPESSSHDDSIDSNDQLEAAVSLSVLSVGISAVRERSNRALQQRHQMEAVQSSVSSSITSTSSSLTATTSGGGGGSGSILVIMSPSPAQPPSPPPRSSGSSSSMHNLRESVRLSSSSGRLLSSGDLVPIQGSGGGRQLVEEEEEEGHQSGTDQPVEVSFDLDSSTESAGSRVETGRGEPSVQTQEVTSSTVSVITSGPAASRTSDGSSPQLEGGGEHGEVVVTSSSSNGSNSAPTTEARQEETETNNDRTGGSSSISTPT
ncbi:PREDICTED: WD repeat-containing protein 26-like isoform X1 [Amphimedon queenslandica]|uniref:CTLH domain-containing protein n=1 Tax=Amphimedon queenslandica TaxID=400682 RepID=A0AAN0K4N7_AMPQE|nr:PREDICTED: WD repeat-containing protein 26-like isoform X1 [Amphimedon queenslandica]|eukprot:XP_019864282.1 PREDICTED: WD repeat-containing protein 26-like isoform X1 [Amphimedon queenslandica]